MGKGRGFVTEESCVLRLKTMRNAPRFTSMPFGWTGQHGDDAAGVLGLVGKGQDKADQSIKCDKQVLVVVGWMGGGQFLVLLPYGRGGGHVSTGSVCRCRRESLRTKITLIGRVANFD